jgi:hypothetical protein
VPDPPINLAEDITLRTSTANGIIWDDGPNDGGEPVEDYRIYKREQGGTYFGVAFGITTKSYTASGLVLGTTY